MDDNQIRIPTADGIKSTTDELFQLYSCLEDYQTCSYEPLRGIPPLFLDKYETAAQESSDLMTPFPTADNRRLYSTSSDDPAQKATGRQIAHQTTDTLFDIAVETLQNSCSVGIKQLLPQLHDGLYWAKRGGLSDVEIQAQLDRVHTALEPCLTLPPEPAVPEPLPPPVAFVEPSPVAVETLPPFIKPTSPLKLVLGVRGDLYPNKFLAVDGQLYTGLKYYLNPERRFIVQSGVSLDYLRSIDQSSDNRLSTTAPYFYLGGGIALPKGFEIMANTQWDIIQEKHVVYYGTSTEPTTDVTTKLDFDAGLQLGYKGLQTYAGYHVGRGFYFGVGYEQPFNI